MIKAIVFDFFGVLTADATQILEAAAPTPAARQAISDITLENDFGRLTEEQLTERLAKLSGRSEAEINKLFYDAPHLNPSILSLIKRGRAHFKVALLSNASHFSFKPYWSRAEMDEYFDVVVVSAEVGLVKPNPMIYELVCERLGVEPAEAIFIDDIPRFVTAAEAMGMTGIVFTSFDQLNDELARVLGKEL